VTQYELGQSETVETGSESGKWKQSNIEVREYYGRTFDL